MVRITDMGMRKLLVGLLQGIAGPPSGMTSTDAEHPSGAQEDQRAQGERWQE
jgi:hypothetical protein